MALACLKEDPTTSPASADGNEMQTWPKMASKKYFGDASALANGDERLWPFEKSCR